VTNAPVPFEMYQPLELYGAGIYLHGTKADLAPGDLIEPGRDSNFEQGRI
jgi:rifampin ADP-ribosylating transferase